MTIAIPIAYSYRKKNVSGRVIILERVSRKIKTLSLIMYSGMIEKKYITR